MKFRFRVIALLTVLLASPHFAARAEPLDEARLTATAWLRMLDVGDYGASWNAAADGFKAAVSEEAWNKAAQAVRSPLGRLKSRTERSATRTLTLPGAPDGEYVVLQFDTAFDNKAQGIETVTARHDANGQWKVAGYFIR